ncbi:MAG: sigma-70 family RNA polymerase sigma factor, partial [Clostridia bacterium]|nr:sigma-70 family RNA polymerase sigma factor [Clostridia bacterium]
ECSFTTWLFRIAVNCAKDAQRTSGRHRTVSLTQEDEDGEGAEWDLPETNEEFLPEESLDKRERITGIRRAIGELPDEQRQVLILRDLHELPYSQIAELLSLELGTVKSRLNRARQNLKNILKNGNFL